MGIQVFVDPGDDLSVFSLESVSFCIDLQCFEISSSVNRGLRVIVQNVGKPEIFKRFIPITKYFIKNRYELTPINLNKKSIQAFFKDKIDLDDFVKKNKIKIKSEEDIIKILEYWVSTTNY